MSGYHDHDTLTKDRLADLEMIWRGKSLQVQRNRIKWFIVHGYIQRTSPVADTPQYELTIAGLDALVAHGKTEADR